MKKVLGWGATFALSLFLVVAGQWNAPAQAAGAAYWKANGDSQITGEHNAVLVGGNTSVETTEAWPGLTVEAGTATFQYQLESGALCTGGAPRMFATVGGTTVNSWDGNPEACGSEPDTDGWRTVSVSLPAGKVTALGLVYDNGGTGEVRVKALTVAGAALDFTATEAEPSPTPTTSESASPSPSASESPSPSPSQSSSTNPQPSESSSAPAEEPTGEPSESTAPPTSASPTASESQTALTPVDNSVGGGDLPVTGAKVLGVAGLGGLLIAAGGVLFIWARKRREA